MYDFLECLSLLVRQFTQLAGISYIYACNFQLYLEKIYHAMRMNSLNQHSSFIFPGLKIGCSVFILWYDFLQRFFEFGMKKV